MKRMKRRTWREYCSPLIARVIRENDDKPVKEIKRALRDKYPFHERQYWPYQVWLDEIKKQIARLEARRNPTRVDDLPLFRTD